LAFGLRAVADEAGGAGGEADAVCLNYVIEILYFSRIDPSGYYCIFMQMFIFEYSHKDIFLMQP
jgi:hypothetical protein